MNEPRPIDENEFAQRLEKVDAAAKTDSAANSDSSAIEDPIQKEQFDAAARVIGMIHRVRKSKSTQDDATNLDDTADDKLDTRPQHGPVDAQPADDIDIESFGADGTAPHKIGRFQIQRQLGRGGYGLVFLAQDPQLDRQVALKVPRAEAFLNSETRSRFLREAKAAGGLNHANIVPVFEAGHVGPICYIASAYCNGPSLGQWVLDHEQAVPPSVAADWLITLADAVQHAHSRGIIHRDLKPDNVLIEIESDSDVDDQVSDSTAAPLLRITDFGLAKDLDDQTDLTQTGSVVGTPSFMSPEQTDLKFGEPSQRLDIYGLGAILYFVLCKVPPINGSTLLETIKNVQEQPPVRPSKNRPDIPRDLEAICLKCLEKQPQHQYQTASELQSDLIRFRNGLPVLARRPSPLDRALMWCRRRPAVSALTATLFIVLAISSIALSILLVKSNSLKRLSDENANKATESAGQAIVERDRSREALHAMTSGVASNWLGAQRELTSEQTAFLQNTVTFYRKFAAGDTDSPEDRFWVAQAEHRLAQLLRRLGEFEDALSSADQAISLLEEMPADWEPSNVALELADSLLEKDANLMLMGKIDDALPVAERAVAVTRELIAADPENFRAKNLLAKVTGNLGSRLQQLRQFDKSLAAKTESVLIGEQLLLEQPDDVGLKRSLGIKSMNLGVLLVRMRKYPDARERFGRSLQIRNELVDMDPESAVYQFDLAFVLYNLAGLESRSNNPEQAEALTKRSTEIARKLFERLPLVEQYRKHLISSLGNQSAILNILRKFDESRIVQVEMNSLAERSVRDFPNVPLYQLLLANGRSNLATALSEQGQNQEAIQLLDESIVQLREMIDQSIEVSRATQILESALYGRATALGYVDRHDDAIADWDALIKVTRPDEVNTVWLCRATSLVKKGEVDSALADVERVLSETMELPEEKRDFNSFYNSACVYSLLSARVDNEDESREHALRAIELLRQAIDAGLSPLANVRADPELEPLHSYPEYQAIVRE